MNATTDKGSTENPTRGRPDRSATDLEREGDEIRADLDRTLDEIERKFSPGELLDRSMEFLRENGSEFLREAGDTVRRNPVPVLLTAAGLIWLTTAVASSRTGTARLSTTRRDQEGEEFSSFRGSAGGDYGDYRDYQYEDAPSDFDEQDTSSRMLSAAQDVKGKLSRSARVVQERTSRVGANLGNLVREQPIALGALALAAGALLGAALPITQYENRLIGPVHDRTMARAKQAGERQYEQLRQAVERGNGGSGSEQGSQQAPEPG